MKTPKKEIERAKTMLTDYKQRVEKGEKFTTWEEFKKELHFTAEEEKEMEREKQKIYAKIDKKNAKLARKSERQTNNKFVKV